jgi:SAM-dependent methyltransferase
LAWNSSELACVVCGGADISVTAAAEGPLAYCGACFHAWRPDFPVAAYSDSSMCSHEMNAARYSAQLDFISPYAPQNATYLEIGCATGALAARARSTLSVRRYDGIELSPAGIRAKPHLDTLYTEPLPQLLALRALTTSYDVVVISHVLEHLRDPGAELAAMKQVLAPRGVIFIEVPNGSGHPNLPIDDNIFHLHFFSVSSLSRLLASAGLNSSSLRTGVRVDARCTDAMQVIAQRFDTPTWSKTLLSDHPIFADDESIVVWAAGGTAKALLANFFDVSRIDFFIDGNPAKQGSTCLGRPVRAPDSLGVKPRTVLINSIDFVDSIVADVERLYPGVPHRIVRLGDLL